jgi:hypothetical protein
VATTIVTRRADVCRGDEPDPAGIAHLHDRSDVLATR